MLRKGGKKMEVVNRIVTSFGFSTMFTIGAFVWVIGTVLFITEVMGYEITIFPPGIRKTGLKWDAMAVIQTAIVAALFGGGLVATAGIVFVPGIAYLRPAQALVVVFGILFGIPGSLGAALGNLIADLFGGYLTLGSVAGFIGNFLNGYIPYLLVKRARHADLNSGGDVVRYVIGSILGALVIGFYIPFWLDLWKIIPTEAAWTGVFGNILLNGTITVLTLGLVLTKILFPFVKKWNMYWEDRQKVVGHDEEAA